MNELSLVLVPSQATNISSSIEAPPAPADYPLEIDTISSISAQTGLTLDGTVPRRSGTCVPEKFPGCFCTVGWVAACDTDHLLSNAPDGASFFLDYQ
ncbi:hypothetical protein CEXT_684411 [Caerostris extrusa]|uniref:Uncharacterized protein n=1 Tax=Caerostris extrusa TaxID=172846 RepID=A0AAV4XQG5_CAEEX|nr:hypothetical protein CEXT_684411 [Caerostris extrusa]